MKYQIVYRGKISNQVSVIYYETRKAAFKAAKEIDECKFLKLIEISKCIKI